MRKRTTLKMLPYVLAVVLLAGSVFFLTGFNPFKEAGVSPEIAKKLELTDEQVAKIEAKKLETKKNLIDLKAKIKVAELELKEALNKDEVDLDAVLKKVEEIGALRTEMRKLIVSSRVFFKNILTPEQREKLAELKQKAKKRIRERVKERIKQHRSHGKSAWQNSSPQRERGMMGYPGGEGPRFNKMKMRKECPMAERHPFRGMPPEEPEEE